MPHTICYVSKSREDLSKKEIGSILDHASAINNECIVSGILLHSFGNFFQILEGGQEHITSLYNKILKDPRHGDIIEVYNHSTAKPVFLNYNSNFHVVTTNDHLNYIRKYLRNNKNFYSCEKILRLLKPFDFFD
ncbi:BLUF domain-containing protein [Flavimarina sp. Hel_I_48]|uniref:BLUF domain-containing protein n=1 Tax=Flavimarina sp. Hel_I_48 TaxID=1392488 RepID=UPI0013DAA4B6|nr:BLUF domain-containing protein [Flavimarina sp. Hel_I_48]